MYNQTFSGVTLFSLIKKNELTLLESLFGKKDKIIERLETECSKLNANSFRFLFNKASNVYSNGNKKGSFEYVFQDLVLRKIHLNIKRIYSIRYAKRNQIIKQLLVLLQDTYPIFIGRFDISSFYENVNRSAILTRIEQDMRLSSVTLSLIKQVFNTDIISSGKGIPRGLGFSAALAELSLKSFDLKMKRLDGVYYYARYVDDIIVFVSSQNACSKLKETVAGFLKQDSLSLNQTKTQILNDKSLKTKALEFLGYSFLLGKKSKQKKSKIKVLEDYNQVHVSIAEKKIKKIKTRLVRCFVSYIQSKDFTLLLQRLLFLTGNICFKGINSSRIVHTGIFYNYQFLTDQAKQQLKELDGFYQHLLHCRKGQFGRRLTVSFSEKQKERLEKLSFWGGYKNRITNTFSLQDISRMKQIWI